MRKAPLCFFIILYAAFFIIMPAFGCSCAVSSCSCGNSVCDPLPQPKTSGGGKPLTTWYYTDSQQSRNYGPGIYLENSYKFTDSDCQACGACNCHSCGPEGGTCCSTDYCCQNPVTSCLVWQTCSINTCGSSGDGCHCDPSLCQGWCMDNAPVYDGNEFTGCRDYSAEYKALQSDPASMTICRMKFGGTCTSSTSGGKIIYSLLWKNLLCPSGTSCMAPGGCSSIGGICKQLSNPLSSMWNYCDELGADTEYLVTSLPEGALCAGADESCCVPVKTDTTGPDDPRFDKKYTLVPDPHPASGGTCYCNYLAIRDYEECSDSQIKDSHPCNSNNCAPDFLGGKSYCCPQVTDYRGGANPKAYSGCAHIDSSAQGEEILCLDSKTSSWVACDQALVPALDSTGKAQKARTSYDPLTGLGCYSGAPGATSDSPGTEILYNGMRLTCDNGQWRNSVGCGETLFNYKLRSDTTPPISDKLRSDPIYGFKTSPIAFYVNRDKPTDIIAYAIPKAKDSVSVEISVRDSQGKPLTDPATTKDVSGDGTRQLKLGNVAGSYRILFTGNRIEKQYNISVDCYTPDKSYCDPENSGCGPASYCVEDAPTNIASKGEKICTKYEVEESYWNYYYYPPRKEYRKVPKVITKQNCFYCCPAGYCAHKVTKGATDPINSKVEDISPLKKGEDVKLVVKDSRGREIPNADVRFELDETSKSVCELDESGTVRIAGGMLSTVLGSEAYDTVCKIKVSYGTQGRILDLELPIDNSLFPANPFVTKGQASIKPLTYSQWSAGDKKEFGFYDSQGDRASSGIEWSSDTPEICNIATTPDYGIYEALKEGDSSKDRDCILSAEWNGETAKLTQKIIALPDESDIVVYAGKTIDTANDYTIECYPPGIQKLDQNSEQCNWVCSDGVWGKGGVGNAPCEKDCDCNFPDESTYACTFMLDDASKKICCEAGQCAIQGACVDEGHRVMKGGVLQECRSGKWTGSGMAIKSDYSRTVLSKKNPEKDVALEISKNEINTDKPVALKAYHFFEKSGGITNIGISSEALYGGNKKTTLSQDNAVYAVSEVIEIPTAGSFTVPLTYNAMITIPNPESLSDSDYIIYLGSSIVAEVVG